MCERRERENSTGCKEDEEEVHLTFDVSLKKKNCEMRVFIK